MNAITEAPDTNAWRFADIRLRQLQTAARAGENAIFSKQYFLLHCSSLRAICYPGGTALLLFLCFLSAFHAMFRSSPDQTFRALVNL